MSGTVAHPEGITNPPIDDLLAAADGSKYALREIDASLLTVAPYDPAAQVDAALDAEALAGEGFETFDVDAAFDPTQGFDVTAFDAPDAPGAAADPA